MIRRGAQAPVEFAGRYTVPMWGCGSGCSQFVIVDSISGTLYDAPFAVSNFPGSWEEKYKDQTSSKIEFRPDSRLLKVNGCPNERECGFYDLVMREGKGLRIIRKQLLPPE